MRNSCMETEHCGDSISMHMRPSFVEAAVKAVQLNPRVQTAGSFPILNALNNRVRIDVHPQKICHHCQCGVGNEWTFDMNVDEYCHNLTDLRV